MLILFRQIGHVLFIDIRRIGDDQIVLQLRQIAEQVGTDRRHVMDQAVGLNVVLGDGQRVRGDIYRIDFRLREGIGAGDGDAAATGAHIKDVLRLMVNQSGKLVIDQFANRGARHQHPLINVKLMAAEPRFVGQIGDGNTLVHAANHPLYNAVFLAGGQARSAHVFRDIQRQIQ